MLPIIKFFSSKEIKNKIFDTVKACEKEQEINNI
jgi:hypothetical protein